MKWKRKTPEIQQKPICVGLHANHIPKYMIKLTSYQIELHFSFVRKQCGEGASIAFLLNDVAYDKSQ